MRFTYSVVAADSNSWPDASKGVAMTGGSLAEVGARLWGLWSPVFGLPMNTAVAIHLITTNETEAPTGMVERSLTEADGVSEARTRLFVPTSRPTSKAGPDRAGIYVHRWMRFRSIDVEEAVALSTEAWSGFESAWDAEIQGLFRETPDDRGETQLLLLTWYRDLATWQASRRPTGDSTWENFLRRHALTLASEAHCTELVKLPNP